MGWQFSGAIDKSNIKEFQDAFNTVVLPKINEFLANYKLSASSSYMSYGSEGIKISLDSSYVLSGGRKPWADSNFFEDAERSCKYRFDHPQHYDDVNEVRAFYDALPKDKVIIGKRICIPSKRYPNEMYKVIDYVPSDTYPFKCIRERDQKQWSWKWDWNFRFQG